MEQDREGWGTPARTFQKNRSCRVKNPKRNCGTWGTRLVAPLSKAKKLRFDWGGRTADDCAGGAGLLVGAGRDASGTKAGGLGYAEANGQRFRGRYKGGRVD